MASVSFYARSMGVLSFMWGLIFALFATILYFLTNFTGDIKVAGLAMSPILLAILFALLFVFLQFLISPFLIDLQLSWIYDMSWITPEQLPQDMYDALMKAYEKHNFSTSKIGLIHDNMPNAFTYGWGKSNARIVVTEGIINLLEPEERVAVLTHEIGHIVHLDFIFMTIAQAIPLLFYFIYISSRAFAETTAKAKTDSKGQGGAAAALMGVAVLSYLFYMISGFVVLLLSRYREHYADIFAAYDTKNPNAMSSALVKVAYGLVAEDSEKQTKLEDEDLPASEKRQIRRKSGYNYALRTMGLADVKTAKGLVMQAYGRGNTEVNPQAVAQAAAWDLETPWAKFIELNSTHPLTGKRLKALDDIANDIGQPRKYPGLGQIKIPESLWDEFISDLFFAYILPVGIFIIPAIGYGIVAIGGSDGYIGAGIGFIIVALLWYVRIQIKYPGSVHQFDNPEKPPNTVVEALTSMEMDGYYEASPVRGKPIVLEGVVMGKGTPGFILSEDFVVKDNTGFMVVDFSSIVPFYNLWFSWKHVPKLMGTKVRVVGWYHRSIMPRIQLFKLYKQDGEIKRNRWRGMNLIFVFILLVVGIYLILSGQGML